MCVSRTVCVLEEAALVLFKCSSRKGVAVISCGGHGGDARPRAYRWSLGLAGVRFGPVLPGLTWSSGR